MKSKLLTVVLFALFFIGIVSAANFAVSPGSVTLTQNTNTSQFTVTNTNSSILLNMIIPATVQITGSNGYIATFNIIGDRTNINASSPRTFTISPQTPIDFSQINLDRTLSSSFNIGDGSSNSTFTLNLQNSFCSAGNRGSLDLSIDYTNYGLFGDESTWYPTENISVEVTVENRASSSINDIVVSWGLYNTRTGEFIISDDEKRFNLKDGKDKTITINFEVDPADINVDDNSDDFVFLVKAYSEDLGEDNQCEFNSDSIIIPRDDNLVVLDKIKIPTDIQCGETGTLTATVWNIGDSDEQDIVLRVYNKNLKIDQRIQVGDLDTLEDKKISFDFTIPQNMTVGYQTFELYVIDEDGNVFESDDNVQSIFRIPINISGGCEIPKSVSLSASAGSNEAIAGQESTITATLRNTGSSQTTYQILITNVDSWATIKSIEPATLTLGPGESGTATITLIPDNSVQGDENYKVQVAYGSLITEVSGTLTVSPHKSIFNFTGFSVSNIFGNNGFIWAIAILNIILVIIIIVIAIRIARK